LAEPSLATVSIYEVGEDAGQAFIAVEYLNPNPQTPSAWADGPWKVEVATEELSMFRDTKNFSQEDKEGHS
jgi:hypothetical protein